LKKLSAIISIICILAFSILSGCTSSPAVQVENTQEPSATVLPPTPTSTPTSQPTSTPIQTVSPKTLTDQAGKMCDQAFMSAVKRQAASAPLLTLVKYTYDKIIGPEWRYIPSTEQINSITEARSAETVQTLVCVQVSRTSAGSYDDGTGAYILNWKVRLVRWSDGQVVGEKSFVGGKPPKIKVHGGDGYGQSPVKEYNEWLLNLFAADSVFVQGVGVSSVAFSPDSKYLVVGGSDYSARIWDIAQHKTVFTQAGKDHIISSFIPAVFVPGGQHLALGYLGGMNLLSIGDWKTVVNHKGMDDIWDVAFSSDGSRMAAGLGWGVNASGVKMYETAGLTEIKSYPMQSPVGQVIISPLDAFLIAKIHFCTTCTTIPDSGIFIWDFKSGTLLNNIKIAGTLSMALLDDGKTLAVAVSKNNDVLLYDLASGQPAGSLQGHADEIRMMAQSVDGKWLASADLKGTINIWDTQTRQIWRTSQGNDLVSAIAFSPDGGILAVGNWSGTVELWNFQ
jgi:WD40 repeat protein